MLCPPPHFVQVTLVALVAEHEHLSRLLHSPHAAVAPPAVYRIYPQLSDEQYEKCCNDSAWLGRQVDVCHECGEWLDDNKHLTARRKKYNSSQNHQQQRSTAGAADAESRAESDDDETSMQSITQLVNRVLTMPAPS